MGRGTERTKIGYESSKTESEEGKPEIKKKKSPYFRCHKINRGPIHNKIVPLYNTKSYICQDRPKVHHKNTKKITFDRSKNCRNSAKDSANSTK